jgi:lipoprotein-releasing system permease protein
MSRLPFELFLALRYLRPKRTFVSVITLISVIGVTLGVAVLIIVISVMSGFDRQLRDKILGFNAHLKVFRSQGAPMTDYAGVMKAVSAIKEVKAAAPFVMGQVLIKTEPDAGNPRVAGPWVRGIEPRFETNVSSLATNIVQGSFDLQGDSVLIGVDLAHNLGLRVGDRLVIYSPRNMEEMEKQAGKTNGVIVLPPDFVVRGIFDVGYYEYNASVIGISLENAQELYELEDGVHGLLVMLDDPFKAEKVRSQLYQALGPGYLISTWAEENASILSALVVEKKVMFIVMFFTTVVAAFGIMNSLITFVVQKTREIGMLKALGAARAQVLWLFLSQGLVVGVVGVVTGFILSMIAVSYRNEFLHFMRDWTGLELFPASIYQFTELPALIVPSDIAIICGSALVMCVLAGLIPAWIASRLRPVQALRYE